MARKAITTGTLNKVYGLNQQGKSTTEICELLGMNRSTVNYKLREMGICQRPRLNVLTKETRQGVERAYKQGKTRNEIMTMFGISAYFARQIEKSIGIPPLCNRVSDKKKKDICRYYRLGWPYEKIDETVGVSAGYSSNYISRQGLCNRNAARQDPKLLAASIVVEEPIKQEEKKMEAPKFVIRKTITVEGSCYHYAFQDGAICITDPRSGGEGFAIGTVDRDEFVKEVREMAAIADMIERGEV